MKTLHRTVLLLFAGLFLALPAPAATQEGGKVLARDGQRVEVQVRAHEGSSTAVCLESAERIEGRKRLTVSSGNESIRLTTAGGNHGPHCAFLQAEDPAIRVRLEYFRLVLLAVLLAELEYDREEGRGKTLTFRWVEE
jgi:hypothetical protein